MPFKSISKSYRVSESGEPDAAVGVVDNVNQDPLCDEFGRVWARQYPPQPPPPQPAPETTIWLQSNGLTSLQPSPDNPFVLIVNAWHSSPGTVWLQLHDKVAAPVDTDIPVFSWPMPAAPALSSLDISGFPFKALDGLWFVFSSTGETLTLGPTGWFNALVGG